MPKLFKLRKRPPKGKVVGTIWKKQGPKTVRTTNMMRAGRFSIFRKGR